MNSANTPSQQQQNPVPEAIPVRQDSYFDGKTIQLIGYRLLMYLVCLLTLGIAYPWMLCLFMRWETKHTVIHGRRLRFDGRGGQLIGRYLLWSFLTLITLGIYGIWLGLGMKRWSSSIRFMPMTRTLLRAVSPAERADSSDFICSRG